MESSDESFVWSRASTGSTDSGDDKAKVKVKSEVVKEESPGDSTERYLRRRAKREQREASQSSRHSEASEQTETIIEEKFHAEETVVQTRRPRTRSTTSNRPHCSSDSGANQSNQDIGKQTKKVKTKKKQIIETPTKPYTSKEFVSDSASGSDSDTRQVEHKKDVKGSRLSKSKRKNSLSNGHIDRDGSAEVERKAKLSLLENVDAVGRKSKISDRIQFEDDDLNNSSEGGEAHVRSFESPVKQSAEEQSGGSHRMRRYLRVHPELVPSAAAAPPRAGEELWLLRLPSELRGEEALQGAALTLGGERLRLKAQGGSYEGRTHSLHSQPGSVTLAVAVDGRCVIRKFPVNGSVRFHRKIPPIQVANENTPMEDTESIALPETKTRHPLFGADYKKALKLPSVVRKRLRAVSEAAATVKAEDMVDRGRVQEAEEPEKRPKKKKRKRDRDREIADESAPQPDRDTDCSAPKRKRPRKSTNQWDSAKDIEQNLFNF